MSTVAPIYIGDLSISEVPGAKFKRKRGVADTLTRPYQGNVALLQAFITANPVFTTRDYEYPWMTLEDIDATEDGPDAKVTLTFVGATFAFGSPVASLQTSGRWSPRSTQLFTDNAADGLWIVNYYSPELTYKYVTSGQNDTPIYQGASRSPSTITILDSKQTLGAGGAIPDPSYVRAGTFQFTPFSTCSDFRFDQKGETYNYQETWIVIIQPTVATGYGPGQISIGGLNTPPDF